MATLKENMEAIKLEKDTKILPENLKSGITAFGVTGTYEGNGGSSEPVEGAKIFESIEEMNNSTGNVEGDLAIIYKDSVTNATVESQFQTVIMPNTVVLSEALPEGNYIDVRFEAVDTSQYIECMGSLDSSMFDFMCYSESGEIRASYESEDGITYTRTDGGEELVDFGTVVRFAYPEMWDDAVGYFFQVGSKEFNGLFKFKNGENIDTLTILKSYEYTDKLIATTEKIVIPHNQQLEPFLHIPDVGNAVVVYTLTDGVVTSADIYKIDNQYYWSVTQASGNMYAMGNSESSSSLTYRKYTYDYNTKTATITTGSTTTQTITYDNGNGPQTRTYQRLNINLKELNWCVVNVNQKNKMEFDTIYIWTPKGAPVGTYGHVVEPHYVVAETQFTALPNDVYEKEFYGKNGVETGILGTNISTSFNDSAANVYAKVKAMYDNMEKIVLTSATCDQYRDTNIVCVPDVFDTSDITDMSQMFYGCTKLLDADVKSFDTSKVTSMMQMFCECNVISKLDLSNFNTNLVTNTYGMFSSCYNLVKLDMSNLNIPALTDASYMFIRCTSLKELDISSFDFSNVKSYTDMFKEVPADCLIYVKDQTAKDWVLARRSDFTNVQIKS